MPTNTPTPEVTCQICGATGPDGDPCWECNVKLQEAEADVAAGRVTDARKVFDEIEAESDTPTPADVAADLLATACAIDMGYSFKPDALAVHSKLLRAAQARIAELEGGIKACRETNARLNRRCQDAESSRRELIAALGTVEKILAEDAERVARQAAESKKGGEHGE